MKTVFQLKKHALLNTYIFGDHFNKRQPLIDKDSIAAASLWYIPIFDFDLEALRGKKIKSATLRLEVVGRCYPLEVELTTITQDWNGKYTTYYECDKGKPWAFDDWASAVINGNGNSFYFREKTSYRPASKLLEINVPAELIYALANRQSFGFGLVDCKSMIYAEEKSDEWKYTGSFAAKVFNLNPGMGCAPELEIEYSDADLGKPAAVKSLEAAAVGAGEAPDYASVVLSWTKDSAGAGPCCYYKIYMAEGNGESSAVEQFLVPRFIDDAHSQGTEITHLKPGTPYTFEVAVSNGVYESDRRSITVRTAPAVEINDVTLGERPERQNLKPAVDNDDYRVYLTDDTSKVCPVSGSVLEAGQGNYKTGEGMALSSYPGFYSDGKLAFTAAPGEKAALQLVFENRSGKKQSYSIKVNNDNKDIALSLFRIWYLETGGAWYPEAAIPLGKDGRIDIPFTENTVPGQVFQSVLLEASVPDTVQPACYNFSVIIELDGERETIAGSIAVKPFKLIKPEFTFEVNGYVATPIYMGRDYYDPGYDGVEEEYYSTAMEHDMTINILPYNQMGEVQPRFAPRVGMVDGELRVTDWSEWDAHFAKYLDGTYTVERYGKRIPVTHMYLPFHENWPLSIHEYYRVKTEYHTYPENINDVKLKSTTPEDDFLPGYRDGLKSVFKDFIRHFDDMGWQHVQFQFYLNNKHYHKQKRVFDTWLANRTIGNEGRGSSWWLLDEPNHRDDFEAIYYYGSILKEAQKESNSGWNIKYRVDISGYNYMFDYLDGVIDLPCINARAYGLQERKTRRRSRLYGEINWMYVGLNDINTSNADMTLLVIDAWLKGSKGMLPWYNFANDEHYEKAATTSGFYPGNRFGLECPVVSLRIKSARKGMELLKYLETFRSAFGYNSLQMRAYIAHFLKLKGEALSRYFEDAGTVQYSGNNCTALEDLKQDIIRKLTGLYSAEL